MKRKLLATIIIIAALILGAAAMCIPLITGIVHDASVSSAPLQTSVSASGDPIQKRVHDMAHTSADRSVTFSQQ